MLHGLNSTWSLLYTVVWHKHDGKQNTKHTDFCDLANTRTNPLISEDNINLAAMNHRFCLFRLNSKKV